MKKLMLDLDELTVESFDTDAEQSRRGTVLGREESDYCGSAGSGCDTEDVCCYAVSVGGACGTSSVCDDLSVCWGGNC